MKERLINLLVAIGLSLVIVLGLWVIATIAMFFIDLLGEMVWYCYLGLFLLLVVLFYKGLGGSEDGQE
jgi:hypothetical protein